MTNPEAEKLRALLTDADVHWPDEHTRLAPSLLSDKLDEALATERRLTIERVEQSLFSVLPGGHQGTDWAIAILADLAAPEVSDE